MSETIDHTTGEIIERPNLPSVREPARPPTPYQSPETGQIADALAQAQGEMDSPKRTKTGKIEGSSRSGRSYAYEYKYAPFEEVVRVLREFAPKHGLSYQQGLVIRGEQYFIRTYVRHSSGEWIASDYPVIADRAGPQGFAAATTYAKRYGLSLAFGLAAEDDDDGASAQTIHDTRPPASELDAFAGRPVKSLGKPVERPKPEKTENPPSEDKSASAGSATDQSIMGLMGGGLDAAGRGTWALRSWWTDELTPLQRHLLKDVLDNHLKPLADKADAAKQSPGGEGVPPAPDGVPAARFIPGTEPSPGDPA